MASRWDNHEPAPLEYFHGIAMDLFHEWRRANYGDGNLNPPINGIVFGDIIAKAKIETYKKYPKQINNQAILKTEL